jgi:DNA-binding HxlR family transcriptional regulator
VGPTARTSHPKSEVAKYGIRTSSFVGAVYALGVVKTLGQYCSISRSLDVLGERWSLLVVREVLMGSHRFGDIRRGIPRISRTMLSARLRELVDAGVLARTAGASGPTYELTKAGRELESVVRELGVWGQRWLPRTLPHPMTSMPSAPLGREAPDLHRSAPGDSHRRSYRAVRYR